MTLYLNISTAVFIFLVATAVTIASWDLKDRLFYIRTALLFIPVVAEIRQIIVASGSLEDYPLFIFLVYFLLRCIGPLLNWHTHLQLGKSIRYFNVLNVATYLLLGYVVFDFGYSLTMSHADRVEYVNDTFRNPGWFSFTYPVLQLLHAGQAVYLMNQSNRAKNPSNGLYFIRIMLYIIVVLLLGLQISYFFLDRLTVELLAAPIIFLILYTSILFVSIKFSSVHNKEVNVVDHRIPKQIETLSDRENQVMRLIAEGKTDKEISNELNVSLNTVQTYCRRIYSKLNLKNRTEAANLYNKAS